MTRLHALFTVLAGLHLLLVICGATKRPLLPKDHPAETVLRLYGSASGSDSHYGFFAPGVGPQLRAIFILTDEDGKTWTETMGKGLNREAFLRAGCPVTLYGLPDVSEEVRKGLLTSWAANMLARHPSAVEVTIHIEIFDPPAMADYQAGQAAEWKLIEKFGPFTGDEATPVVASK